MKRKLLIITGPTAVGKSALSVRLAKKLDGEIISADSMQVYRGMDIGSAKITPTEMEGIRHYLIDELSPTEEFNIVQFQTLAKKYIKQIADKGKLPIIVGGTGFYIQSVLYDIHFDESAGESKYRDELQRLAVCCGNQKLHEKLAEVDPEAAKQIHENNVKRVIRALEYHHLTGDCISTHNAKERERESPYDFCYFVLNDQREEVYRRINERVELMIAKGLVEEVQKLKVQGCTKDMISMQGLGYKEILSYLDGECSLDEAVYMIKRDTRHFAKRQITWFKREKDVIWVDRQKYHNQPDTMIEDMISIIQSRFQNE